jgi:nucleotide-binding universal stress UspA family protein
MLGVPGAYRHIGVASTFSPRFQAVLAEADNFSRCFESPLSVIHAAPEHDEASERFRTALTKLNREADTKVVWSLAETPTEAILNTCSMHGIDLLLAGALEREGDHRNFVRGVARDLLQLAPCDLLLLTQPSETPVPFPRVVVEVDLKRPSPVEFLNRTCELASRLGVAEMVFVGIVTPFDEARSPDGPLDEARLNSIVDEASGFEGEVDCRLLRSTTGFAMCDFLQENGNSLFIAGSRRKDGARRLPTRLDWLLQVIPTNVLLLGIDV